jgi:hypothetical protein
MPVLVMKRMRMLVRMLVRMRVRVLVLVMTHIRALRFMLVLVIKAGS